MSVRQILSGIVLEVTVFVCGALVMIYEITGSRLLAPFIGSSTYVWTSLIGIILAALSFGYWLGGRLADRRPELKILAAVIFLAGGAVGLTMLLKDILLGLIAQSGLILELKSMIAALLLFAPASVLLGFVTPYSVKLKTRSLDETGRTVGRLYALSTVGSISGTFLAGFFLIPFVGSTKTLYLIGASLFALSVMLAPFALTRTNLASLVLFVFGLSASEGNAYFLWKNHELRDFDTEYNRVQIFRSVDEATGRPIRAMAFDPQTFQSKMYLDGDDLATEYLKYYHLVSHFKPDFEEVLMIGGAGYSFPKDFLRVYPEKRLEVVEIDPLMTEIAKKHFNLEENKRLKITHEDGRIFLNRAPSGKYDAVLIDAFSTLFSVPFQLTTIEAVREIERVLKDDGVVIFNLGGALKGPRNRFFEAELATYKKVFGQVSVFKVKAEMPDEEIQNLVFAAVRTKKSISFDSNEVFIQGLLKNRVETPHILQTEILSDDLAPVEYFNR